MKTSLDTRVKLLQTIIHSIASAAEPAILMVDDKDFQDRVAEVLQAHSDALRDLSGAHRPIGFVQTGRR